MGQKKSSKFKFNCSNTTGLPLPVAGGLPMDSITQESKGYVWAVLAGLNAALAAVAAKFFSSQLIRYGMVVVLNAVMWGCYVNSLKALSSLQATVTNFATNFLSSGLAGYFLFQEALKLQWFAGATLIVVGVIVLSKSSKVPKPHSS